MVTCAVMGLNIVSTHIFLETIIKISFNVFSW